MVDIILRTIGLAANEPIAVICIVTVMSLFAVLVALRCQRLRPIAVCVLLSTGVGLVFVWRLAVGDGFELFEWGPIAIAMGGLYVVLSVVLVIMVIKDGLGKYVLKQQDRSNST